MRNLAAVLFVAGLLLLAAPAATAAPATDAPTDLAQLEAELFPAPSGDCDPEAALGEQDAQDTTQYCGSCSVTQCQGAERGQPCWTSQGWGACNINATNDWCSTGGWKCVCYPPGGHIP